VIVSSSTPTLSSALTLAVKAADSWISVRLTVADPASVKVTVAGIIVQPDLRQWVPVGESSRADEGSCVRLDLWTR
jgi:hypothetical protein